MSPILNNMLNRAVLPLCAALLLLGALAAPAQAQDRRAQEIRTLLEQRDREIKDLLGNKETFTEAQRQQLQELINGVIDFEAMGRAALGPHWGDLTPKQRSEFVDVFSQIVRAQSLSDLDMYRTKVTYDEIDVDGDKAHVVTTVTYKDVPTKVAYDLGYGDRTWHVEDILVEGVSTAGGYARSFQSVVRKRGFDTLMSSLHKKLDKMQS